MKQLIIILCLLFLANSAWAENPHDAKPEYSFGTVTGNTDNSLDSVDGNVLQGGETATIRYLYGMASKVVKFSYTSDATCTETPDGFEYVQPVNNPGTKMWVLDQWPQVVSATDPSALFPPVWTVIWIPTE